MIEQKYNVCKHFKNIFLINDFYGSLLDKILNIEMRKTHTIVIKKTCYFPCLLFYDDCHHINKFKKHFALYFQMQIISGEACYCLSTHPQMHRSIKKCDKLHAQIKLLTICMFLLLNCLCLVKTCPYSHVISYKQPLFIRSYINKYFDSESYWLILQRNQNGFLLRPVYKH